MKTDIKKNLPRRGMRLRRAAENVLLFLHYPQLSYMIDSAGTEEALLYEAVFLPDPDRNGGRSHGKGKTDGHEEQLQMRLFL